MARKKMVFINDDGTITRTWPPLEICELDEDPRYRVGGDIPADAIKSRKSREDILDDVIAIAQRINSNNEEILKLISKSQK
mgnify:CR=1 FL=1|jgi:hypothetical protein